MNIYLHICIYIGARHSHRWKATPQDPNKAFGNLNTPQRRVVGATLGNCATFFTHSVNVSHILSRHLKTSKARTGTWVAASRQV